MKRYTMLVLSILFLTLTACADADEVSFVEPDEETVIEETESTTDGKNEEEEQEENEEEETEEEIEEVHAKEPENTLSISDDLTVHFIDVGQADATLLQYKDGENHYHILYDAGDWRGNEVVHYLKNQGVETLDIVMISHPDADHIGQLDQVMEAFDVGEVWMSGNASTSDTFQRAVEAVLASDADYSEPRAGESFEVGPLQIDILYPDTVSGNSNEESLSALFTYGNVKFVFTGDAARNGETYMRNHFDVKADVLHVGHHGSNTSSDPAFIDAVSPTVAIYSAGANNSYGHPSPEVVRSFEERGIDLYGTDVHGTVIVTTDGESVRVDTSSQGEIVAEEDTNTELQPASEPDVAPAEKNTGACVNINEASFEEVQEIIHIGPERAEDLIELRPYKTVDELERISGIGESRIADIKTEGTACVQ